MLKENKKRTHFVVVGKGGGGGIDQVQSDWNQTDNTQVDYIKNKPSVSNEWFGTQAEFDLIDPKDANTVYYIEDANGSVVHNGKTYGIKVIIEEIQPNPFPEYLTVGYKVINNPDTFQIISSTDYSGWRYKGETEWRTPVTEITVNDYYGIINIEFNLVDNTKISNNMFRQPSGSRITKVELPASVTTIGNSAFFRSGLKEMPNLQNVTVVGEDAFYDLRVLTYDYIVNDSLDRTGYHSKAFNCSINSGSIAYVNGDVYDVISDNVSDLDLTNGINGLPIYRFRGTSTLQFKTFNSVKFPATLTHLMGRVFQSTTVTDVYFYGTTPPICETYDDQGIFYGSSITNIYVPSAALAAYQNSPDFADVVSKIQAMP